MSSNTEKDFGYAPDAAKRSNHPEVARRDAEIEATELDEHETRYALWVGKSIKWKKNQHPDSDFSAKS